MFRRITLLLAISTMILTGCVNKADKQFTALVTQADTHYASNEYKSAYTVYGKALDIREDVDVRRKHGKASAEIELAEKVEEFRDELREVQTLLDVEYMPDAVNSAAKEIMRIVADIKAVEPTVKGLRVGGYLSAWQESFNLQLLDGNAFVAESRTRRGGDYVEILNTVKENIREALKDPTYNHNK